MNLVRHWQEDINVPSTTKGDAICIGGGCPTAQNPQQLKVRFFVVLYNNLAAFLHYYNMSSIYQITPDYINDAINALYDDD